MTNQDLPQSVKRHDESLASLFTPKHDQDHQDLLILTSSSDIGVCRNSGRNGARFAPQAILSCLKKMTLVKELKDKKFKVVEVSNQTEEQIDFSRAQELESELIKRNLSSSHLLHLGGGHDHIYPLLKAIDKPGRRMIIINLDAHADTRTDREANSGTPFRQFSQEAKSEVYLVQIGLNPFANSFSTLSELENVESFYLYQSDISPANLSDLFLKLESLAHDETDIVLSLDVDALQGAIAPGVSAVNPTGLDQGDLKCILDHYKKLIGERKKILGVYELNPIYDTVSSLTSRTVASFIFSWLK